MMHRLSEAGHRHAAGETYKMNAHHVTLRQNVEEIRLRNFGSKKRGDTTRAKEVRERYERPRR